MTHLTVRPLVWTMRPPLFATSPLNPTALCIMGRYKVAELLMGEARVPQWWAWLNEQALGGFDTEAEAKACAQRHFEQSILLEITP